MALLVSLVNSAGALTNAAAFVNGVNDLRNNFKMMTGDQIFLAFVNLGLQALMTGVGMRHSGVVATFNPMAGARQLIKQYLAIPPQYIHYGSTEVAGNEVAIRLVDNHHYEIFVGPEAVHDVARINHHIALLREIEGDIRFFEMFGRLFGTRTTPEMASAAADIIKLTRWITYQKLTLEQKITQNTLEPGELAKIRHDIKVCEQRLDQLTDRLAFLRKNPTRDIGGQPILLPDSTGPGVPSFGADSGGRPIVGEDLGKIASSLAELEPAARSQLMNRLNNLPADEPLTFSKFLKIAGEIDQLAASSLSNEFSRWALSDKLSGSDLVDLMKFMLREVPLPSGLEAQLAVPSHTEHDLLERLSRHLRWRLNNDPSLTVEQRNRINQKLAEIESELNPLLRRFLALPPLDAPPKPAATPPAQPPVTTLPAPAAPPAAGPTPKFAPNPSEAEPANNKPTPGAPRKPVPASNPKRPTPPPSEPGPKPVGDPAKLTFPVNDEGLGLPEIIWQVDNFELPDLLAKCD